MKGPMKIKNATITINGETYTGLSVQQHVCGDDDNLMALGRVAKMRMLSVVPIEIAMTIKSVDGYPVADLEEGCAVLIDAMQRFASPDNSDK